jgi:hypothetical protein
MSDQTATDQATRRTKRRYAHELYPHPEEDETRTLAVDVPYLFARAVGLDVRGTGWFDLREGDGRMLSVERTLNLLGTREMALIADALLQGLAGDEAWTWAQERLDESGEWTYERAKHYGVPIDQIKHYPCGPEPEHHDHLDEPDARGWQVVNRVDGKESECAECTEELPADPDAQSH